MMRTCERGSGVAFVGVGMVVAVEAVVVESLVGAAVSGLWVGDVVAVEEEASATSMRLE